MPKKLESCVRQVQAQINSGKLPKGSNAWAICIDKLRSTGVIKKGKGRHWLLAKAQAKAKKIRSKK